MAAARKRLAEFEKIVGLFLAIQLPIKTLKTTILWMSSILLAQYLFPVLILPTATTFCQSLFPLIPRFSRSMVPMLRKKATIIRKMAPLLRKMSKKLKITRQKNKTKTRLLDFESCLVNKTTFFVLSCVLSQVSCFLSLVCRPS